MLLLSAPEVNVIAPLVGGLIEGQVSISVWACVSYLPCKRFLDIRQDCLYLHKLVGFHSIFQ